MLKYCCSACSYLEKQHKRNPLVVTVIYALVVIVTQPALSHFGASVFAMLPWHRERIRNPAIRINDVNGNATIINA